MPQHEDPLVYNADRGVWQNASNPGPSNVPAGLAIGTPGGSRVRLAPTVGNTIQIDGGPIATIEAAIQLQSGAGSEVQPGHVSSVVFSAGAVNEQIGTLSVSAMANGTAQATLLTSDSADGTVKGTAKTGTIVPGGTTTWAFTTAHQVIPSKKSIQVAQGFNLNATDPSNPTIPEDWHQVTAPGPNIYSGFLNYILIPVSNGGIVCMQWYFTKGNQTVPDAYKIVSLPNVYAPAGGTRIPCACDGIGVASGNLSVAHIRVVSGSADVQSYGVGQGATFLAGSAVYPVNVNG